MILNRANVQTLIEHYRVTPIESWSYMDCVAGVLVDKHLTRDLSDPEVARALGIPLEDAKKLIAGPYGAPWFASSSRVVKTLEHLLASGHVVWQHV